MMDTVSQRIAAFGRISPDNRGECPGKFSIIEELEDDLADERVLSFFLTVIADQAEFDLARIEALKILRLWKAPSDQVHARIGRQIALILPTEEDILVQQWAAIAASGYVDVPEVFASVAALLADPTIDLDVRYNCLSALDDLRESTAWLEILRPLVVDDQLGATIGRLLDEETL